MAHVRVNAVRRLFARLAVALPALAVRSASGAPEDVVAVLDPVLLDISATGARMQVSGSDMTIGDRIALSFTFADRCYRVVGTVVWTRPHADVAATLVGLRFERIEPTVRDHLIRNIGIQRHRRAVSTRSMSGRRLVAVKPH
jgi:c-di-GMP-binding flagellar brake protein YcgR